MNKNQVLKMLSDFVAIPSVSTDPERRKHIIKAVSFLEKKLGEMGFKTKLISKKGASPLIVAYRIKSSKNKTIGIYGHYDVQPEDPLNEWNTKPFKLTLNSGKLIGRGVADNKGHIIQNIVAVEELINKDIENNFIFILEGEEEIGSANFESLVNRAKNIIAKSDVFYITDMGMRSRNQAQIYYGLRGIVSFELTISIGKKDLHSGIYGNSVYNAAHIISSIVNKLKDPITNRVLIPGFYNDVRQPSKSELILLNKTKKSIGREKKESGVYKMTSFNNIHPSLVVKTQPSLDVNGVYSGYQGKGVKTVIPSKAVCKITCRLVEDQSSKKIQSLVINYIKNIIPEGVKYSIISGGAAEPFYTDINTPEIKKTLDIFSNFFTKKTVLNRSGGSIPAAEILSKMFNKPIILTGFTLPDDNIHSPNENYDESMFWKGIGVLKQIYQ